MRLKKFIKGVEMMDTKDLYTYKWPSDDFQVKLLVHNKSNDEQYEKSFHGWIENGKVKFSGKDLDKVYDKVGIIKVIKK